MSIKCNMNDYRTLAGYRYQGLATSTLGQGEWGGMEREREGERKEGEDNRGGRGKPKENPEGKHTRHQGNIPSA